LNGCGVARVNSRWTKGARKQYNDIWMSLETPKAMQELEESVLEGLAQIEIFPESAPQYRAFRDRPDIRMLVVGSYRLIYQIDEEELRVIAFQWGGSNSALD